LEKSNLNKLEKPERFRSFVTGYGKSRAKALMGKGILGDEVKRKEKMKEI